MPGILDFLGNLFGGGQQQAQPQPAGGLTDPSLYQPQAPPEYHIPFAYKLAMLGSSINRSYGGKGGMDVGSLATAYMENQKTQYEWQQTQAERQRKLEGVIKYADKIGGEQGDAIKALANADPDAAIKFIYGVETEKAKPQPVHDRPTALVDMGRGAKRLVYTDTGEDVIPYTAPPPLYPDETGGATAPPVAVPAAPVATAPAPVTSGTAAEAAEQRGTSVVPVVPTSDPAAVSDDGMTPDMVTRRADLLRQKKNVHRWGNDGILTPEQAQTHDNAIEDDLWAIQTKAAENKFNQEKEKQRIKEEADRLKIAQQQADTLSTSPDEIIWQKNPKTGQMEKVVTGAHKQPTNVEESLWLAAPERTAAELAAYWKNKAEGAPKINLGPTGVDVGDPEKGLTWARNPDGSVKLDEKGVPTALPYHGGSVEAAQQEAEAQKTGKKSATATSGGIVLDDIHRSLKLIEESPYRTTGLIGSVLQNVPGTSAYDTAALITTIKSNASIDKLMAMREASKTGAALSNISNQDMDRLEKAIGNLELAQGHDQVTYNLKRVYNVYADLIYGPDGGPPRMELDESSPDTPKAENVPPMPKGFVGTQEDWNYMTPEERGKF